MVKHDFKVGDGVSYSAGSDRYPGTVIRVTNTRIFVQDDKYECTSPASAYGADDAVFKFTPNTEGGVRMYSVKNNGRISGKGGYGGIGHGRRYYQDPSF